MRSLNSSALTGLGTLWMTSLGHKVFGFLASSPTFCSDLSPMSLFTSIVEDSIITPLLRIFINRSGFMQRSFGLTVLVKISFVFVEESIFSDDPSARLGSYIGICRWWSGSII
jgi:hypothetical protein